MIPVVLGAALLVASGQDKTAPHQTWRIRATVMEKEWAVMELKFQGPDGSTHAFDGQAAASNSQQTNPKTAFDNDFESYWEDNKSVGENWVGWIFFDPVAVARISIMQYPHENSRSTKAVVSNYGCIVAIRTT